MNRWERKKMKWKESSNNVYRGWWRKKEWNGSKKRRDYWECKESMAQKEGKNEIKKKTESREDD